ncbi:protein-tyrosine phosphatase-like protein [Endogone sp. FLAS-F59071]|nr:protein-tyrosine phosphatase-like protein [Endogone sp. FLAS-F59071]|eukprot:RUS19878.1 protein-tyrosine phosphatase-like protein [Endogone sp. FLAS-F59071]
MRMWRCEGFLSLNMRVITKFSICKTFFSIQYLFNQTCAACICYAYQRFLSRNSCSERSYDDTNFNAPVSKYPINDHQPPPFEMMEKFCREAVEWLNVDPDYKNVVVIHCKAGKGRTGTMVCTLLLYRGMAKTAEEAIQIYDEKRTWDGKGLTVPSQKRYVHYFEQYINSGEEYKPPKLTLTKIVLTPPPKALHNNDTHISVYNGGFKIYSSRQKSCYIDHQRDIIIIKLASGLVVAGDIKVAFFYKGLFPKHKLFHFWINTHFILADTSTNNTLFPPRRVRLTKPDIDNAVNDRYHEEFDKNFAVEVVLEAEKSQEILNNWSGPVEGESTRKRSDQGSNEGDDNVDDESGGESEQEVILQAVSMHDDVKAKIAEALAEKQRS